MRRMVPLFLVLCLLLGGCSLVAEPVADSQSPTERVEEITKETLQVAEENSAYPIYAQGDTNAAVLALILNEPFENEPEATVVWNEGEYDRLYIIPRYVGSWVNVYGIIWDEEGMPSYTDKAVYSTYVEEGCVIYAALDRPEGMPCWYIEVTSPTGETAGKAPIYNGMTGTPPVEKITYDLPGTVVYDREN